jgi:threonine/homoserine/homoserine lactone efflux protein
MPDASTLGLFSVAALALLVIPGPAVTYIVMRSVDQGRTAGLVSILGIHTGSAVHVAAAVLGLSAILASSATAFTAVKLAGAAYLIAIGVRRLMAPEPPPAAERVKAPLRRVYVQGFVVNLLNPKTALFFLAFLPQFVDPVRGAVALQVATLGLLFIGLGLVSDGTYAVVASAAGRWLRASAGFRRAQRYVSGTVYVGLGVTAALTGGRAKA